MECLKVQLLMRDIVKYWSSWQDSNKQAVELNDFDNIQIYRIKRSDNHHTSTPGNPHTLHS